jgi:hypothetical protein
VHQHYSESTGARCMMKAFASSKAVTATWKLKKTFRQMFEARNNS